MHEDKPYSAKKVGERIRWFRVEFLGLTQEEFAHAIGLPTTSSLSQWENGKQRLSLEGALAIHEVYGLDPNYLYLNRQDGIPQRIAKALATSGLDAKSA